MPVLSRVKKRIVIDLFTRFGTTPGVTERRVDIRADGRTDGIARQKPSRACRSAIKTAAGLLINALS